MDILIWVAIIAVAIGAAVWSYRLKRKRREELAGMARQLGLAYSPEDTAGCLGLPFAFYVSVVAIVLVALIQRRTALGMLTESVGINPEASRLAGVRSRGIIWGAYAVSGLLAGFAGILYSSNIMAADANAAGQYIELDAILAVVLGGTSLMGGKFSIAGTVIGVFTIQTLKSTITFLGVPPAVSPLFLAMVVVIVVLVQSQRVRAGTARLWAALTSRKNAEVAR